MKRIGLTLALLAGLLLGACSSGSNLPNPTGKASISAINAIYGSPAINFLIEERTLGTVTYKSTTIASTYDDLDYNFNFEVFYAGDTEITRIASQPLDMVADQAYTLLASGTLAAPTITVWETAIRNFADTETVFQARFANTSNNIGDVDIYFDLDGVAPVLGAEVASLSFGEISAPMDFETDSYVITITTSGDPADVLFQSSPSLLLSRTNLIITPFDGDANDTAPLIVRALNVSGSGITFPDPLNPPSLEFLHAAQDMGISDIYDDEALTSRILADHDFKDLSPATQIPTGEYQFLYTPAGDTTIVNIDTGFGAGNGFNYRIVALGTGGEYSTVSLGLNRRSVETSARLNFMSTSSNVDFLDLYVVAAGTPIDGFAPFRTGIISRQPNAPYDLAPGDFDIYLTEFLLPESIVAGPFPLSVALGDVVDLVAFDTEDTAALEIVEY